MMEFAREYATWIAMAAIVLSMFASLMEVPRPTGVRMTMIKLSLACATIWIVTKVWQFCCMGEG